MSMLKSQFSYCNTLSHSPILSLWTCWTINQSLFHSPIQSLSTCLVFMSMMKNHTLTLAYSHTPILSLSHSFKISHSVSLNMPNNFCFHVYAEKSHSHTLTPTLSHSHTLSFTLSRHAEQLLFSCLGSKVTVHSRKLQWFFWDFSISISPWV